MFGKYNGFVSKARVSACMYFLVSVMKMHSQQQMQQNEMEQRNQMTTTDTSFHRQLLVRMTKKGKNWTGEIIQVPEAIMKYIQYEPRELSPCVWSVEFKRLIDKALAQKNERKDKKPRHSRRSG